MRFSVEPRPLRTALLSGLSFLLLAIPANAQKVAKDTTAEGPEIPHVSVTIPGEGGATLNCNEQAAQSFLIRANWFPKDDPKAGKELFAKSLAYRTEKYGYFTGFGDRKLNPHPPGHYAKATTFMGMTLTVNQRIIPALACVEAALKATKASEAYKPGSAGGIRYKNTYRGGEISNHLYGIAIDIEPQRNTCCSCVDPWPDHPLCKKRVSSIFERMAMPRSWVVVFERYGFYWLGHDALQDTMHFEFLGDPDAITTAAPSAPAKP